MRSNLPTEPLRANPFDHHLEPLLCAQLPQARVGQDQPYGFVEGAGLVDQLLLRRCEEIAGAVPGPHVLEAESSRLRPRGVTSYGLVERHVEVIEQGTAEVLTAQSGQHLAVPAGREDAFQDYVEAMIERIAGDAFDHPDVRAVRLIQFVEDHPADEVLLDPCDAVAV